MAWQQIQPFLVALAIGLLLGLERERGHSGKLPAGSRSFALLSLAGAVAATFGMWAVVVGLGAVAVLMAVAYFRTSGEDPGTTTEIAAIVAYLLGALAVSRPAAAGALALLIAGRAGWSAAYLACAAFALPAMLTGLIVGEPARHVVTIEKQGLASVWSSITGPFVEFMRRSGAWLVLLFILVHKIGDTLANLTFRLLFNDLGFSNDEIAIYDVAFGFWAYLAGIFIGGLIYTQLGLKRSVLIALVLMGVSNLSFALLAAAGHSNLGMAAAIGFENLASGYGGVVVVAYFSALCNLQFTAAQYALISAAASVVGRVLTGTTAGTLIEQMGYVNFYLLTTLLALPGILLFWFMMRAGMIDRALGTAGRNDGVPSGGG